MCIYTYIEPCREEVNVTVLWLAENNLILNTRKMKELIVDFRKNKAALAPLVLNDECVERVFAFKFLGIYISENISWSTNMRAVI